MSGILCIFSHLVLTISLLGRYYYPGLQMREQEVNEFAQGHTAEFEPVLDLSDSRDCVLPTHSASN